MLIYQCCRNIHTIPHTCICILMGLKCIYVWRTVCFYISMAVCLLIIMIWGGSCQVAARDDSLHLSFALSPTSIFIVFVVVIVLLAQLFIESNEIEMQRQIWICVQCVPSRDWRFIIMRIIFSSPNSRFFFVISSR